MLLNFYDKFLKISFVKNITPETAKIVWNSLTFRNSTAEKFIKLPIFQDLSIFHNHVWDVPAYKPNVIMLEWNDGTLSDNFVVLASIKLD